MPRGRKPGRPKGSKNKIKRAAQPIAAATIKRGRNSDGAGVALATIISALEMIPNDQRRKVMQTVNVFIGEGT